MPGGSTSYDLSLLLTLKDKASPGIDKFTSKLTALDAKLAGTYKGITNLQRAMSQPVAR